MRPLLLQVLLLALLVTERAAASDFFTLRTGSARLVYYSPEHSYIVPHLIRSFENAMRFHGPLFNYTPSEDVLLFLQDFDDYGYAGATSLPRNYMILGIEPYEYTYETSPTNERINWVVGHELMHIVASDPAAGPDRFFRSMFMGKVLPTDEDPPSMYYSYLASPRKYAPRWYHEGIAVFMETWMSGGIGRAQNGYDEMVFRTMVRDRAFFFDFVGLESEGTTVDFQVGANSYLYGTRFVSYLADQYGPEKVVAWFGRTDTSNASYGSQFERVFGSDIDDLWGRWIDWEHQWQMANLDSIRLHPLTSLHPVVADPLGAVSRSHYDVARRKIYVGMNSPGEIAHIAAIDIDAGAITTVCDVPTASLYNVTSTAYDPATGTLFFTTKNSRGWRDIRAVDVQTGDVRTLLHSARIGDLAFNKSDNSLWGLSHHNGLSTLTRIPYPYTTWQDILPLRYGTDLYDPDISPDGSTLVASMMEANGRQQLVRFSLDSLLIGSYDHEVLWEFENTAPLNFVFSPDGGYLYGSTYYTGVANIVRYDLATKEMEWLTNTETGLFRPIVVSGDSILAFHYSSKGFTPVLFTPQPIQDVSAIQYLGARIAERHPIVQTWKLPPPSPARINVDSLTTFSGAYEGLGALEIESLYPIIHGYKNSVAVGLRMNFHDPLLLHSLDVSGLYAPTSALPMDERFHGTIRYRYWGWNIKGTYNYSDFYDLFGPTKTSRKGYGLTVGYNDFIVDDRPMSLQYNLRLGGFAKLERLPAFQNIATSAREFLSFAGELTYARKLRSLGAVDYEKGIEAMVATYGYYARTTLFPLLFGSFDVGLPLFRDHSSLWIRTAAGYGFGDPEQSFSNYYFGGFGNNWVDHGEVRRFREATSFPGVELNAIGGTNFVKGTVEWDPPPLRFRRVGTPLIFVTWARASLFTSGLITELGDSARRTEAGSVGAQADFKLVFFSSLSSTLSFGYARAASPGGKATDEFMFSLKIL